MGTYTGIMVDKLNLDRGQNPRFVHQFEIDSGGYSQNGRWRQGKSNDTRYWKTAASEWTLEDMTTQVPRGTVHQNQVHLYDGSFNQKKILGINVYKELNKSAILQLPAGTNLKSFPMVGLKSTGYLLETNDYGHERSDKPIRHNQSPNIYWGIVDQQLEIPPLQNLWVGGGFMYGGKTPVLGAAVIHGWLVNYLDISKVRYFQVEIHNLPGKTYALGGKAGIVLILANAADPFQLINKYSKTWNFDLCLGGSVYKLMEKLFVKSEKFYKFIQVVNLAEDIFNNKGKILNTSRMSSLGHLKTLFSSTELAVAPSYSVIDLPLDLGLQVGISQDRSVVTMVK